MPIVNLKTLNRLRELADSNSTDVTNYSFRTLEEIKQFLNGIDQNSKDKIRQLNQLKKNFEAAASRIVIESQRKYKKGDVKKDKPEFVFDTTKLQKSYDIIDKIHDQVESLDSMINNLTLNFKGQAGSGTLINQTKALRARLQGELDKAYTFLTSTAVKHEPSRFVKIVTSILDEILDTFKNSYAKYKQTVYITPYFRGGEQLVLFSRYVEFINFQNDEGIVYPKVYLVFNCLMNSEGALEYSVNSFRDFSPPGRGTVGADFTTLEEGRIKSYIELEHYNFITQMERTAIPSTQKELDAINWGVRKEWIKSVKLDNDAIDVKFTSKVKADDRDKATAQLLLDLKTFFATRIKAKVVPKPYKDGNTYGVDFLLTMPDTRNDKRQMRLDSHALQYLQDKLSLSPSQAAGLVKALNQLAIEENERL